MSNVHKEAVTTFRVRLGNAPNFLPFKSFNFFLIDELGIMPGRRF